MSVELHFNGQRTNVTPGASLFQGAFTLAPIGGEGRGEGATGMYDIVFHLGNF
ncbi:MAG TPA: hypothetical protein VGI03_05365 [Verrucomicrobiae bacterium]|jgi:hypothetical protein